MKRATLIAALQKRFWQRLERATKWVTEAYFRFRKQRRAAIWQRYNSDHVAVIETLISLLFILKRCMTLQKDSKSYKNVYL